MKLAETTKGKPRGMGSPIYKHRVALRKKHERVFKRNTSLNTLMTVVTELRSLGDSPDAIRGYVEVAIGAPNDAA